MVKYIIITGFSTSELENNVNEKINAGYSPLNGPFIVSFKTRDHNGNVIDCVEYNQAMMITGRTIWHQ